MIIINADDWGRSHIDTNATLSCYREGRITSVTAMVFMEDSVRAANISKEIGIDVGLHLNLSEPFTGEVRSALLSKYHERIVRFITFNKYSFLLYNPILRRQFRYVYQAQVEEFVRMYGKPPSHIDGHQHKHLCSNMLLDKVIPVGERVRRNFYFWPEEKSLLNRTYRLIVDQWLASRYRLTDYFFALSQCIKANRLTRVIELAKVATVELMAHPANSIENDYLMSDDFLDMLCNVEIGSHDFGERRGEDNYVYLP